MARARNIKPGLFQNDLLGELCPLARLVFIGMWTIADFKGCIEFRPKMMKVQLLPYDDCDIEALVNSLEQARFIRYYSVQGKRYIKIVNFEKHQNPHKNERDAGSEIPDIQKDNSINELTEDGTKPELIGTAPADSGFPLPSSLITESTVLIHEVKEPTKICAAFALPDWIDQEAWDLWLKTRKKKMIPEQMQAQVKKLATWRAAGLDYAKSLSDAAVAGWQGLVEPVQLTSTNRNSGTSYHEKLSDTAEQIFGRKHGTGNQIIDITPKQATGSDPENIPAVYAGLRA